MYGTQNVTYGGANEKNSVRSTLSIVFYPTLRTVAPPVIAIVRLVEYAYQLPVTIPRKYCLLQSAYRPIVWLRVCVENKMSIKSIYMVVILQ